MATTTPYSIYYPIASDSVAPLHTAFSTLADSVNAALTTHVKPLVDGQQSNRYTVASVAAMNALTGMPAGSTAFVTATKASYQYDGTAWVLMYQPWTSFASTLAMYNGPTTAITTGFTVGTAEYMVANNIVTVQVKLTLAATPASFSTGLYTGLPLSSRAVLDANAVIGKGTFRKSGTVFYDLNVHHASTDKARILYLNTTPLKNSDMKSTPATNPDAFTAGTVIVFSYSYSL